MATIHHYLLHNLYVVPISQTKSCGSFKICFIYMQVGGNFSLTLAILWHTDNTIY